MIVPIADAAPLAKWEVAKFEHATPAATHCLERAWFTDCRVHTTDERVYRVRIKQVGPATINIKAWMIAPTPDH